MSFPGGCLGEQLITISLCGHICHFDLRCLGLFFHCFFVVVGKVSIEESVELKPCGKEVGKDHHNEETSSHCSYQTRDGVHLGEITVTTGVYEGIEGVSKEGTGGASQ